MCVHLYQLSTCLKDTLPVTLHQRQQVSQQTPEQPLLPQHRQCHVTGRQPRLLLLILLLLFLLLPLLPCGSCGCRRPGLAQACIERRPMQASLHCTWPCSMGVHSCGSLVG